jgi:hypothetical protein
MTTLNDDDDVNERRHIHEATILDGTLFFNDFFCCGDLSFHPTGLDSSDC